MRFVQVREYGDAGMLDVVDGPEPEPRPGQLLVDVAASGVNFMDVYQRQGIYRVPTPFPIGSEGAGQVRAVGAGVDTVAVGDRVAWKLAQGSYAEQVLVAAGEAVPVPAGVSDEVAAAVMLQGLTAHYLAASTYPVQPGDTVLVHAAAGGVGLLLTQIVKLRGGRVIATVSTAAKEEQARAAGADEVIRYDQVEFAPVVRELTGSEGVAAAYDGVGKDTFDGSLASLRVRGTMVVYGAASGQVPPFDVQRLNSGGSLFVTRPTLVHYTRDRAELTARTDELFGWLAEGTLDVSIGGRYPLADVRQAHEDLEGRRTTGKLLLLPR